jgi:hypothetical protein
VGNDVEKEVGIVGKLTAVQAKCLKELGRYGNDEGRSRRQRSKFGGRLRLPA